MTSEPATPALSDSAQLDGAAAEFARGERLLNEGDWVGSETVFRALVELYPDHSRSHASLGNALRMQDRLLRELGRGKEARAAKREANRLLELGRG